MALQEMFPAVANSPATELSAAITDIQTTITLLDASKLPDAPNIATIGVDESAETVRYEGKSGNDLTGVTRGFSGTTAKAWATGVGVARYFTAYDADALRENVTEHSAQLADTVTDLNSRGVNIKKYEHLKIAIAEGDDWSASFNQAIADVSSIGGGKVDVPVGLYLIGNVRYASNVEIKGMGFGTILKQKSGAEYAISANPGSEGSSDVSSNIRNIKLRDIHLFGRSETESFNEHLHLLNLNAVSDVLIQNVKFSAFMGDGVYLGSGNVAEIERHNERVTISGCYFDGVNKNNRNGISVIDGRDIKIKDCYFTRCTAPNMPGAVDIEPNNFSFHVIKNIEISNNNFYDIGGNVGTICMTLPNKSLLTTPPENIQIIGNHIDTCSGTGIVCIHRGAATDTGNPLNLIIERNFIKNVELYSIGLLGIKKGIVRGNECLNSKKKSIIGTSPVDGTDTKCMYITIESNIFENQSTIDGVALTVYTNERIKILNNMFIDCGSRSIAYGVCIHFNNGTSSYIEISGNIFSGTLGYTTSVVAVEGTHTLAPLTNIMQRNNSIGVSGNAFQAGIMDSLFLINSYDTTKLPDSFLLSEEVSIVNGDTALPSVQKQGILKTTRASTTAGFRKFVVQWFYPANNDATTLADMYFRKANSATNDWSAWKKLTGV